MINYNIRAFKALHDVIRPKITDRIEVENEYSRCPVVLFLLRKKRYLKILY